MSDDGIEVATVRGLIESKHTCTYPTVRVRGVVEGVAVHVGYLSIRSNKEVAASDAC